MNHKILIFILSFLTFLAACKDTNSESSTETASLAEDPSSSQEDHAKNTPGSVQIYAWVDQLRVRAQPDTHSDIIAELAEGEALTYLEEKTDFTQQISMRGIVQDEPWLKIQTQAGKIGWVYGGGVKFYRPEVDLTPSPYASCFRAFNKKGNQRTLQKCMDQVAVKQLKKDRRFVQREDRGLIFTLLSGQKKYLSWSPNGQATAEGAFHYRYYLPQMGFFVVEQRAGEQINYRLINDKSGRETTIWGFPKASPDSKYLVVASPMVVPELGAYGLRVYGFSERGFELVTELSLEKNPGYQPTLLQWINEQKIAVTLRPLPNNSGAKLKILNLERKATGAWHWVNQ
ncbi:MAG: SH3 domain-containing protein [Bacteroidota bacterium]